MTRRLGRGHRLRIAIQDQEGPAYGRATRTRSWPTAPRARPTETERSTNVHTVNAAGPVTIASQID